VEEVAVDIDAVGFGEVLGDEGADGGEVLGFERGGVRCVVDFREGNGRRGGGGRGHHAFCCAGVVNVR